MRKNESFYTFLLTRTTKERIFIRRIEVSKRLVHTSVATVLLFAITGSVGLFAVTNNSRLAEFAGLAASNASATVAQAKGSEDAGSIEEQRPIDYARPVAKLPLDSNMGGPTSGSYQLTAADSDSEELAIERKLRQIEAESNPRFLPTIWAHLGKINNEFGFRRNPFGGRSYEFHSGMDIDGERGDMLIAPANGVVKKAGWQGGYGYLIEIDHQNGLSTRYGHLSKVGVNVGDTVQRGQLIGLIGSTGRSTGPHLHYELRLDDKAINPRRFLPPEPSAVN